MMKLSTNKTENKADLYRTMLEQAKALTEGEKDITANLANISALIFHTLPELNWAGFYLVKDSELVLGPFQGKPACVRIKMGKGVCGTAAERGETVVVPDVHQFPGHIACDGASNSEIVVPLIKDGILIGVLDVDSPVFDRFDDEDRMGLKEMGKIIEKFY